MGSWRRLLCAALVGGRRCCISRSTTNGTRIVNKYDTGSPIQQNPSLFQGLSFARMLSQSAAAAQPQAAEEPIKPEQKQKRSSDEEKSGDQKIERRNPVSWLSFFLLVATAAAVLYVFNREKKRKIHELRNKESDVKYGPAVGKAAIGGPFKLVNHEGKTMTEQDFLGKWTLMYFGFTSCPDICPDELQKMVQAIDLVEKKSGLKIAPLFVSVDPERDTVEQMKEYVQEFHPRLMGLTGPPEDIKKVAKSFRVYYMKTGDEGDDYLVDHSIIMYLMDPTWEFVKFFGKNYTVEELSQGIMEEVKNKKKK